MLIAILEGIYTIFIQISKQHNHSDRLYQSIETNHLFRFLYLVLIY
jgi:hypothetical protein